MIGVVLVRLLGQAANATYESFGALLEVTVPYDAILIVSFGGPEGKDDVLPFLENVLRGRNVPRERMLAVAEHYYHFDGVSPINRQNRELIEVLGGELTAHDIHLPIYWGNRNWQPFLPDALREMAADGKQRALAFFTSIFSSYSGCRQYRENIAAAQREVGATAPRVEKIRAFFNHPGFIAAMADRVRDSQVQLPSGNAAHLLFTAHSIPQSMADHCQYESQLRESCRLVAEAVGSERWKLVFQSRSGPPSQPWLEPDVGDALRALNEQGVKEVIVSPIGFISDHMEVMYDLDEEAQQLAEKLGMHMVRSKTVGVHPRFVAMICELIVERISGSPNREAIGTMPASHDVCPMDCCTYEPRRPAGALQ